MKSKNKNLNKVIITVNDEALPNINKLADKLGKKGLKVDQVMPMTGVIVGSCVEGKIQDLKDEDGVLSVEKEINIELPPSDDLLQ
ncbi:MAG: hypothetical protein EOO04_28180 [Chitinophagaceae bacterium]|nr:MAG: hypothetical protein EOO04_28180 [Chitinophagaceae bacterium]